MATTGQLIARLFPAGTRLLGRGRALCPDWPPDLFAAAASVVSQSACYARPRYFQHDAFFSDDYRKRVARIARQWTKLYASGKRGVPRRLQKLWDVVTLTAWRLDDWAPKNETWWDASLELLAVADSVAVGMGFTVVDPKKFPFALRVALAHYRALNGVEDPVGVPNTLCIQVPTSEAAVQPKTRTPQTGCTLRGLSHNLALVPRDSEAMTGWFLGRSFEAGNSEPPEPLNLMIVPFPFRVRGSCFEGDRSSGSFRVNQQWLKSGRRRAIDADSLIKFLRGLINSAKREVTRVDAIVLPELALDERLATAVATYLAKRTDLEFFITGILGRRRRSAAFPTNAAYTALFFDRASRMHSIRQTP